MPDPCLVLRDALPELMRASKTPSAAAALPPELEAHAASCEACGRAVAGARALGARLGAWATPDPAADLVARTLARVRLAEAMAPRESRESNPRLMVFPGGQAPPRPSSDTTGLPETLDRAHRRRSSVELLATWALPGPRPEVAELPRQRLGLRLAIQAAAAVILVALCTGFGVTFSPAIVEAWEERHHQECQKHLEKLGQALRAFRTDHPDAAHDPHGAYALRDALVRGGYAREDDFVCPAAHASSGAVSYELRLPMSGSSGLTMLARDLLGNHTDSLNQVLADGKVEHLDANELARRLAQRGD